MNKDRGKWLMVLLLTFLLVVSLGSCNVLSLVFPSSSKDDPDKETTIPDGIVELASGIFDLIGMVFESDDPLTGEYPDGMSVSGEDPDAQLILTFEDFSPPDESDPPVLVNGEIYLTKSSTDSSPLSITLVGTLAIENYAYTTVALDGTGTWASPDADPGVDQPESFSGTFTVDGVVYLLADIMAAIEAAENDEEEPTPSDYAPLPDIFLTSSGNYDQHFNSRVSRLSPALPSDEWTRFNYLTFVINEDGTGCECYVGGVFQYSGFLNWYTDTEIQKLDILDSHGDALFSFTVRDWSSCHLHLVSVWGDNTEEWILSAGKATLSGVVLEDSNFFMMPPPDPYLYKPLSGVDVQLGTTGLTTQTDERGYFEFDDISDYVGQSLDLVLAKDGYQYEKFSFLDYLKVPDDGLIDSGSQYFKWLGMSPLPLP